jgi:hypothetical protein
MMPTLWKNSTAQVLRKAETVDFPETTCRHEPQVHNGNSHYKFIPGKKGSYSQLIPGVTATPASTNISPNLEMHCYSKRSVPSITDFNVHNSLFCVPMNYSTENNISENKN